MKEFLDFDSGKISWFRCGGKIAVFCVVENLSELKQVVEKYPQYSNNILPIGAGSNILIRDTGFKGLAIKLAGDFNKIEINKIEINEGKTEKTEKEKVFLSAGASVFDKQIVSFAINNNLVGCEFLSTIPGTIGGAIKMNAGCFDCEIKDILSSVQVLINNEIKTLTNKDLNFSYRKSSLPENDVILNATFALTKGTKEQIEESKQKIKEMQKYRDENQIVGATCGSTFKNPINPEDGTKISVWKLIDEVGLRGYKIGGAKFSEKHCNFIVNTGNATATDIENLVSIAKQKVKEKFNIDLETEIKIIGN